MKKIYSLFICVALVFPVIASASTQVYENIDSDQDGLFDKEEIEIYHTDPQNPDTDNDGYTDGLEIEHSYSPLHDEKTKLIDIDSDGDELNDLWELIIGTDIKDADSDGDTHSDWTEVYHGYDPLDAEPKKVPKIINVNLSEQTLHYTFDGKLLDNFHISGGTASMPTPEGEFAILDKVPSKNYGGTGYNFYYPNTKWNLHFTTDYWRYYIHGAYWHNNFGNPMSHGCVNVAYHNMENLYNWANVGTKILIY